MAGPGDLPLDPSRIRATGFSTSFRGYDQHEVRRFLDRVAAALESATGAEADDTHVTRVRNDEQLGALQAELGQRELLIEELRQQLAVREAELAQASAFDEDRAAELLGRETTRVLEAARRAAAELTRKAEADVEQVRAELDELRSRTEHELAEVRERTEAELAAERAEAEATCARMRAEAETEARRVRAEAEELLARRTAEADAIRERGVAEAEQIRADAEADAQAAREAAREQGRQMIAEARSVRERVLSDLVRRRRVSRQQVDQLKAGRDRLARALGEVRRQLDEALGELAVAVPEARQAAESISRAGAEGDDRAEVAALERELDGARTLGSPSPFEPHGARLAPAGEGRTGQAERHRVGAGTPGDSDGAHPADPAGEAADDRRRPPSHVDDEPVPDGTGGATALPADAGSPGSGDVGPGSTGGGGTGVPTPPMDLDSLFASIRGNRAVVVDEARQVLAASDAQPVPAAAARGDVDPVATEAAPGPEVGGGRAAQVPPGDGGPAPEGSEVEAPGGSGDDRAGAQVVDDTDPTAPFLARDRALAPIERELLRRLKRTMADAQSELLDLVGRGRGGVGVASLPTLDQDRDRYARAAGRSVTAALRAGAEAGGGRFEARCAATLVQTLSRRIADHLHQRVEETVESAGGERDAMLGRIRAHYREFRTGELAGLVADVLTEAYAVGLYRSFEDGTPLVWTPDPRVPVGPDCFDNSLAGPVPVPEPYPTGHHCPPGAPSCRCLTLPVPAT